MKKKVKNIELKPSKSFFIEAAEYMRQVDELQQLVKEQNGIIRSLRRSNKKLRYDFYNMIDFWKAQYR